MTDYVPWLRSLAHKGGKGSVNKVDARALGRVADELERTRSCRSRDIAEIDQLRSALKPFADLAEKLDGADNLIGLIQPEQFEAARAALKVDER